MLNSEQAQIQLIYDSLLELQTDSKAPSSTPIEFSDDYFEIPVRDMKGKQKMKPPLDMSKPESMLKSKEGPPRTMRKA